LAQITEAVQPVTKI